MEFFYVNYIYIYIFVTYLMLKATRLGKHKRQKMHQTERTIYIFHLSFSLSIFFLYVVLEKLFIWKMYTIRLIYLIKSILFIFALVLGFDGIFKRNVCPIKIFKKIILCSKKCCITEHIFK